MQILFEDQAGNDANMIAFPSLIMCMGVVVEMNDGALLGAHVTPSDKETSVMNALVTEISQHGGTMNRMYCASHYAKHTGYGAGTVAQKANAIGFHGTAYLIDLDNKSKSSAETYVDVRNNGGSRCRIRYKRMAKIEKVYGNIPGGTGVVDLKLKTKKNIFKNDIPGTWHTVGNRDLTTITIP